MMFCLLGNSQLRIEVQQRVAATERHFMAEVAAADTAAAAIMKEAGSAAAVKYLSNFSVSTADALVDVSLSYYIAKFQVQVPFVNALACRS
eukprot:SAG31_NODE_808_length_11926_cov_13.255179_8_plen_91_part_00